MARKVKLVKAVSYLRTSSATNVGADKDSDKRQRAAVAAFAKRGAGFEIVGEFYDPAVKGEDRIETRPGFAALLDRFEGDGVRVVIIDEPVCARSAYARAWHPGPDQARRHGDAGQRRCPYARYRPSSHRRDSGRRAACRTAPRRCHRCWTRQGAITGPAR
jgi:hypothetical protein